MVVARLYEQHVSCLYGIPSVLYYVFVLSLVNEHYFIEGVLLPFFVRFHMLRLLSDVKKIKTAIFVLYKIKILFHSLSIACRAPIVKRFCNKIGKKAAFLLFHFKNDCARI
jgi:hypothetical protein